MSIISYPKRFVFIHIPKTGGTSIEREWEKNIVWGDFVITNSDTGKVWLNELFREIYGLWKHSTAAEIQSIIGRDTFDSFSTCALVRQPLKIIESYYKYGKRVLENAALNELRRKNLPVSHLQFGLEAVLEALKTRQPASLPWFWTQLNQGVIKDAMIACSFDDFLERVADNRWSSYLRGYICDEKNNRLVKNVIKIEEAEKTTSYFSKITGSHFDLLRVNPGKEMKLEWPSDFRRRYYGLCEEEYDLFGYPMAS
jgi:hypothetical protein